jgi:hypothetical protein
VQQVQVMLILLGSHTYYQWLWLWLSVKIIVAYNDLFSLHELQQLLKMLNMCAPGQDMVHNAMLQHLPAEYEEWLLKILNYSYEHGELPSPWKQAIILPILKPGKPTSNPASYHPISLLSCISKLLECLINSQLTFLESTDVLSAMQSGFR